MIKSTELEKGTEVILANGWDATLIDNQKRKNIRLAEVRGYFTEKGSIYVHNIVRALIDGRWVTVEHTDKQRKLKDQVAALGF